MPTEKKVQAVAELQEKLGRAAIAISTEYQGLTVAQINELRAKLRDAGVEMKVVKNTLLRIAADAVGRPEVMEIVEGPTALVLGYDEVTAPAKALTDHIRAARLPIKVRKAWLEGRILAASEVEELARLPSREVLLGQFMGGLQSTVAQFSGLLNAVVRDFASLVDQRASQLEEGGAAS
ncbi:MAG TPA: 50S ribosomal protein L10 [Dehalococcoidia bacterium]